MDVAARPEAADAAIEPEQQQELADGYLMAATAKLGAALGGHAGSSLAHALETWRRASALMSIVFSIIFTAFGSPSSSSSVVIILLDTSGFANTV